MQQAGRTPAYGRRYERIARSASLLLVVNHPDLSVLSVPLVPPFLPFSCEILVSPKGVPRRLLGGSERVESGSATAMPLTVQSQRRDTSH